MQKLKTVLSVDTTALTASAAVCGMDEEDIVKYSLVTVKNKLTHSENLLPVIADTLRYYGAAVSDIDLIAVSAGPGSFTGVRIGISTVKGMCFGNSEKNIPCAAVSTLDALAQNITANDDTIICPVMDARRGQFYNALYSGKKKLCSDRAASGTDIAGELVSAGKKIILCGDGADLFYSLHGTEAMTIAKAASKDQNALSVAVCAAKIWRDGKTVSGAELRPIYLRMPQAERELKEKEGKFER